MIRPISSAQVHFVNKNYHRGLALAILLLTVAGDQLTKTIAQQKLFPNQPIMFLNDVIVLIRTQNPGAILSLGADLSSQFRFLLFVVFASIILLALLFYTFRAYDIAVIQRMGLAFIIGGGAGNLMDRVANQGEVVDFIHLDLGFFKTGIFNLADVAIFLGIFLFLVFNRKHPTPKQLNSPLG